MLLAQSSGGRTLGDEQIIPGELYFQAFGFNKSFTDVGATDRERGPAGNAEGSEEATGLTDDKETMDDTSRSPIVRKRMLPQS